jgi:hypothetical protein
MLWSGTYKTIPPRKKRTVVLFYGGPVSSLLTLSGLNEYGRVTSIE